MFAFFCLSILVSLWLTEKARQLLVKERNEIEALRRIYGL